MDKSGISFNIITEINISKEIVLKDLLTKYIKIFPGKVKVFLILKETKKDNLYQLRTIIIIKNYFQNKSIR